MNTFKVFFTNGESYITQANGTAAEFEAYLKQDGGRIVDENPITGLETVRFIDRVVQIKYKIQVSTYPYGRLDWKDVRPTGGEPYTFDTYQEAQKIQGILYGDPMYAGESRIVNSIESNR